MNKLFDITVLFNFLEKVQFLAFLKAMILFLFGYFFARYISKIIKKFSQIHLNLHQALLLERIVFYSIFVLFGLMALQHLGFSLSILLGATGIFSLALGFAAQTSVSNLISGLFLVLEKPFQVGDQITVNNFTGEVLTIDALSVKLKTGENNYVRIPNETLIKSIVTNLSRFDTRRIEINVSVPYKEDLGKVKDLLLKLAENHDHLNNFPLPNVNIDSFGPSLINLKLFFYTKLDNSNDMKNKIYQDILEMFKAEHIEISLPIQTIVLKDRE